MSVKIPAGDKAAFIDLVKAAQFGVSHGDKRHIIAPDTVREAVGRYESGLTVEGLCGQRLSYIDGVTKPYWQTGVTDLSGKSTCSRCLKKAGLPPEPKSVKCPTCDGRGKVTEASA